MANSAFSNLTGRASGAMSSIRDRFSRDSGRYDDRYDDYGEYGYDDYGEYGYDNRAGDPYDDIDYASGVGEVRTRAVSDSRYHPPLLSFDEARVNTYVPDRLLRDPLERRTAERGYERPGANYTPRVRDSVDMGRSAEYDFASMGSADVATPADAGQQAAASDATAGASVPAAPAAGSIPPQAGTQGYDPYATFKAGSPAAHVPGRKLKVVAPVSYAEVETIARALKAGDIVVLVLTRTPGELVKRVLDFSFGVASALDAQVDCVADKVFVVARGQGLTNVERQQLQAQGVIL